LIVENLVAFDLADYYYFSNSYLDDIELLYDLSADLNAEEKSPYLYCQDCAL
jgi:hypothetical protein